MLTDQKLNEVIACFLLNGEEYTKELYGWDNPDTLRRYISTYEKRAGNKKLSSLTKVLEKFSEEELKMLAKSEKPSTRLVTKSDFSGEVYRFGVLSDLHIGSKYTEDSKILSAIDECYKQKVDSIIFPGDIAEGMSSRAGHVYELAPDGIGVQAQKDKAISLLKQIDKKCYVIEGNHCLWSKAAVGYSPIRDICAAMPDCEYLGEHEGLIDVQGVTIMPWHGLDGASYAISYRLQQLINSLSGGEKPNVLIAGHDHKSMYMFYRNVHTVAAGTLQNQSQWMRMKKLQAHVGFWVIEMAIADCEIKYFQPRFYPFYK